MEASAPYSLATIPKPEAGVPAYAVLGHPVGHSLSPRMQLAALAALGLPGAYHAIELTAEEFPTGIARLGALGYAGWNVTVPHKGAMFERVDRRAPSAENAQAVNTVARDPALSSRLVGHSTDGAGWAAALAEAFGSRFANLGGKGILILGAGGSGRTLVRHAAAAGARVLLSNRSEEKARLEAVASPGRVAVVPWNACALAEATEQVDLIVNTTSVGLKPGDLSPVPPSVFRAGLLAYDLIYRPAVTPFLEAAAQVGAIGANGLSMLLHQGFLAFQLWHPELTPGQGRAALAAMRAALEEATGQTLSPLSPPTSP